MTGTFPLPRGELIAQMQNLGYEYEEHPNSKTEIMLIGEKPGSKAEKARTLGIPLLEGREAVSAQFPLVLKQEPVKKAPAPLQGGLF